MHMRTVEQDCQSSYKIVMATGLKNKEKNKREDALWDPSITVS